MYNLNNPYSLYGYSPVYTSGGFNPYNNLAYNNYVYDQLWLNDTCYRPQNIIYNIQFKNEKKKTFESRILFKNSGCYVLKEKNGQEVVVGSLTLKDKHIVNLHADGTFDAFHCLMDCGSGEYTPLAIPYKDFVKRNILQYLSEFPRNEDCPDKYIVMAFYKELPHGDDIKFLQLPMRSGWQDIVDGKTTFASSEIVIPQLSAYYPQDIFNRKIIYTAKNLTDAGEELGKLLPAYMKYKLLITVRIASVLLYFYSLVNLQPDQMLVIEPKNEYNANTVIALLDNIGIERKTEFNSDRFMFQKIIMATAKILYSYGVFSLDDVADIHFHLLTPKNEAIDIKNDIVNDFRNVISNLIIDEKIGIYFS